MLNIEILKKYKKTEIFTNLVKFLLNCYTDEAEEFAKHILWLYEEMTDSALFYFDHEKFMEEYEKLLPFESEKEEPYV